MIIYYKYINGYVLTNISKLLVKLPNNYLVQLINNWTAKIENLRNYNNKFYNIMFFILIILFLIFKLLNFTT